MAQFDVYRNPSPATRSRMPFLLDVQAGVLDSLATRIVVPLCKPETIGGKTLGADPIVAATALVSSLEGEPIPAFIVRAAAKEHGKLGLIAAAYGPDGRPLVTQGRRVAIVDDTATTGGSLMDAVRAVEAEGAVVALVLAMVDRQQGAAERFRAHGYRFETLYLADGNGRLQTVPEHTGTD